MKIKSKKNPITDRIKRWVGEGKIIKIVFLKNEIEIKLTAIETEE